MKQYSLRVILASLLMGSCCGRAAGQDVHFSQFYENSALRNPALTGIFTGDYKGYVNYRSQWSSLAAPFVTMLASAETRISTGGESGDFVSLGLTTSYDKAGTIGFNTFSAYASVNYNKAIEDAHHTYLSAGFAGGYLERSVDIGKMTFANQYVNGAYSTGNATGESMQATKLHHYDLAAGVSLNSSPGADGRTNYYLGIAGYHLSRPKEAFNAAEEFVRLNTRWTGNAGLSTSFNSHAGLSIHANYQYQQPYQEIIFGGLLRWTQHTPKGDRVSLYGGCFYRWADACIPTIKIDYRSWGLTASYDFSISGNRTYMNRMGGFEFSLYAKGFRKHDRSPEDALRCPRFESLEAEE